jgi:hypothetical protein
LCVATGIAVANRHTKQGSVLTVFFSAVLDLEVAADSGKLQQEPSYLIVIKELLNFVSP